MADVLVGLLLVAFGLVICFAGLRVFIVALPLLGLVIGFFIGAAGARAILGEGFLGTATGIITGLVIGLLGLALAYVTWYVGMLLAAGSSGALLGSGLLSLFGVDSGWALAIGGTVGAVAGVVIAWLVALPLYVVIINTAFAGASGATAGALLVFDQIDRVDLAYGSAWAVIEASPWWLFVWIALAALGLAVQLQSIAAAHLPEERWAYGHSA